MILKNLHLVREKRTESSSLQEENMVLKKTKNIPCKSNFAEKCLPNKRSTMLLPGPSAPNNWKKSSIINRNLSNVHKSFCAEEKVSTLCNSKLLKIPITVKKNQLKRKLKIVDSEASSVAPVRIRGRTAQSKISKKSVSQLDGINETIVNLNSESSEAIFVDHADNIKNYQSIKPAKMRKEHKRKDHRKAEPLFNDKDHLKKMSILQDLNKIAKCTDKQLIIKEDVKKIRDEKVVERSAVSSQSSSCNISDKQYLSLKNSQSLNEKSLKIQGSLSLNLASKKGRNLPEETVALSSMIPDVTSEFVNKPSALTSIKKGSSEIQILSKMTKCTDEQLIIKEELILIKKNLSVLGLASLCRVFTEICKCIGDRFKPLTLCCDLLKEKSLLAPICIASIVGVWKKKMFEISDDSTDEDLLLLSCIAYGAKKKTKKISDSFWDCSYKLLLEYSTIPSIPNTKIAIEHLKKEILSLCAKKSFEKSWQLTSSLLIIAAHEPLDF
ncbi:uncharacterized protein CEXT_679901 [Caerostris extrusa]|uniref:Uncharacterized protein n=1 Tax=Caerostris extrusa TaxID=172846 RepID=A0AAV4NW54_CAEEX|nr:uncharacterized protein CEXT_679901 [Caerostris extrusa]